MPPGRSPAGQGALEDVVLAVSALAGDRGPALLAGLAEPLRPRALALLARLERTQRADRHAALASAFLPRSPGLQPLDEVPGLLGEMLRSRLARGAEDALSAGAIVRWARRLALELGAP